MMTTAFGIPTNQYYMARDVGLDTVWCGDYKLAARNNLWCISNSEELEKLCARKHVPANIVGLSWGDDIPVSELANLEIKIQDAIRWTNIQWHPVLVSATYTRMLNYLEVGSIEEYYRQFAALAPSALPMLCHYPWHYFADEPDSVGEAEHWWKWRTNCWLMRECFDRWWAWIQVSAHNYYDGDWDFYELDPEQIYDQAIWAATHGASGLGYHAWHPLEGDGIVDKDGEPSRHWETIKAINEEVGK